jgi:hypothetical protein
MTRDELMAALDATVGKPKLPERIYDWLDSQLSIARHYGGINYQGVMYLIDYSDPQQPLVREDVIKREAKAAKGAPSVREEGGTTVVTLPFDSEANDE